MDTIRADAGDVIACPKPDKAVDGDCVWCHMCCAIRPEGAARALTVGIKIIDTR